MISERKLAANRANALKSTGPRSEEGKCRVSRNAIKHGITACGETLIACKDYQSQLAELRRDLCPSDSAQEMVVERIAAISVRLRRLQNVERLFYLTECASFREEDESIPLDESVGMFLAMESGDTTVQLLQRYESGLHRALHNAFKELRQLQEEAKSKRIMRSMFEQAATKAQLAVKTKPTATLPNKPTAPPKPLPAIDLFGSEKPLTSPLDLLKSLEANPQVLLNGHHASAGRGLLHR